jgi:hypothetical protein
VHVNTDVPIKIGMLYVVLKGA